MRREIRPPNDTAPAGPALVASTVVAPMLWGLTYIVTAELLPPGRPLLAATARALSAGVILAIIAPARPWGSWWGKSAVLGTLNIGAFFVLLFIAASKLPGGLAATLGAIQPLIAALLGSALLGEKVRPRTVVAGLMGVAGVALLVVRPEASLDRVGVVAGLAGAVSMATGTVLTRRWRTPVPFTSFASWQLLAGGLALTPFMLAIEGVPPALSLRNIGGLGWFAVSTAVAYMLWFRGVTRLPAARVSILGLASPLTAAVAGWAILGQGLTPIQIAGAALVLVTVQLGARPPSDERRTPRVPRPRPARGAATNALTTTP